MDTLLKIVFEKKIEINLRYNDKTVKKSLEEQFSYYPNFETGLSPDIVINVCKDLNHLEVIQKNPSIHSELKNGFLIEFRSHSVAYCKQNEIINIDFSLKPSGSPLLRFLRKFNNEEFASREDRIASMIFETVIIPSLLLFDNAKLIIHSTGIVHNSKAMLIGGTGGCGKTSLELELCLNKGLEFINDDIGVISNKDEAMPNLAHPKIYAYNVVGNPELRNKLLSDKSILNRIQWFVKQKIFGQASVRRRLLVDNYNYAAGSIPVSKYFIMVKENIDDIKAEETTVSSAVKMTVKVILTEYCEILNHVNWHEFNSISAGKNPIVKMDDVINNLERNAIRLFEKTKNYIIRIPLNISHKEFIKRTSQILEKIN